MGSMFWGGALVRDRIVGVGNQSNNFHHSTYAYNLIHIQVFQVFSNLRKNEGI